VCDAAIPGLAWQGTGCLIGRRGEIWLNLEGAAAVAMTMMQMNKGAKRWAVKYKTLKWSSVAEGVQITILDP